MTGKVVEGRETLTGNGGSQSLEELFSRIGATLPPGIWVLDSSGHPFSASKMALVELSALSGESLRGAWRELSRQGEDGPVTMLTKSTALRNGKGEVAAGLVINLDITDKKKREDDLKRHTDELKKSNADLQQFAYIASHDLQEPLRAVSGYLKLLHEKNRDILDPESTQFIESSVRAAARMSDMINDLLTYSRIGSLGRPFLLADTRAALHKALDNLEAAIDQSKAVVTADELPTVVADEAQIAMLFQNLVSNAIKYGGVAPPSIHISARRSNSEWVFSVKDNGIGIDPKYHEKIFGLFQRLHSRRDLPGTGMGLTICKAIVQRHGGRMWVDSEEGKGATFFFTLQAETEQDSTKRKE